MFLDLNSMNYNEIIAKYDRFQEFFQPYLFVSMIITLLNLSSARPGAGISGLRAGDGAR